MGALDTVNALTTLVKNLRKVAYSSETNEIIDKLIDVKEQIVELQSKILELQEENAKLKDNNRIETDYKRLNAGDGTVLVHKDEAARFEDKEYFLNPEAQCFCQYCAQDKKLYVLKRMTADGGFCFWCSGCRRNVTLKRPTAPRRYF